MRGEVLGGLRLARARGTDGRPAQTEVQGLRERHIDTRCEGGYDEPLSVPNVLAAVVHGHVADVDEDAAVLRQCPDGLKARVAVGGRGAGNVLGRVVRSGQLELKPCHALS